MTQPVNETMASGSVRFFDVSDRTQIQITGKDRATLLHNFTSNEMKRLQPGRGCETFVTNIKGKVVAHLFVFCTENSLWLDGTPEQESAILSHLRKYIIIEDVQLISHTSDHGELYVTGSIAAQLLQLDASMSVGDHVTRGEGAAEFSVRRVDLFNEPGFLMSIPSDQIDRIKSGFRLLGIQEESRAQFEARRIVAGFPRYGVDITDDNLAQEVARTKQAISFDKGCYLGQETIARLDSMGHTNREVRRLTFATTTVPSLGTPIFNESGDTEVGVITSATNLAEVEPGRSSEIAALGMVKRMAMTSGTRVSLKSGESLIHGFVV